MFVLVFIGLLSKCTSLTIRQETDDQPLLIYKGSSTIQPRYIVATERHSQGVVGGDYYNPSLFREKSSEDDPQENDDYYYKQSLPLRQIQLRQQYQHNLSSEKELDQVFRNVQNAGLRIGKKIPVEQYLKEVTPTTKTLYGNVRSTSSRFIGQRAKPEQEETRNNKQLPVQYILQSDLRQQPVYQQHLLTSPYENLQDARVREKLLRPHLLQPENALAPQRQLDEAPEETASQSSIYVAQNFKKPQRVYLKNTSKVQPVRNYQDLVQTNAGYVPEVYQQHQQLRQQQQQQQQQQQESVDVYQKPKTSRQNNRHPLRVVEEQQDVPYQTILTRPNKYHQQQLLLQQQLQQQRNREALYQNENHQAASLREKQRYRPTAAEETQTDYESDRDVPNYPVRYLVNKPELKYQDSQVDAPLYRRQKQQQQLLQDQENPQETRYKPVNVAVIRFRPVGGGAAVAYQQNLDSSNIRYYRKITKPLNYQDDN